MLWIIVLLSGAQGCLELSFVLFEFILQTEFTKSPKNVLASLFIYETVNNSWQRADKGKRWGQTRCSALQHMYRFGEKKPQHLTLEGNTAKLSDSTGFKASWCHFMLPKAHRQPQERLMVQRCTTEIQAPTCWARCVLSHRNGLTPANEGRRLYKAHRREMRLLADQ